MTTTDALRRSARVTALTAPVTVSLLAATPALATPAAWNSPEPMSTLTALLIFVGVPLALFVVITLLTIAPSMVRGDRQQRGVASWTEPEWFGTEVPRGERTQGEIESTSETEQGGASGRW